MRVNFGRLILVLGCVAVPFLSGCVEKEGASLSRQPISLESVAFPNRPRPLLEIGEPLLGVGPIRKGLPMPGGATWNPTLVVWGTYRTALQYAHDGDDSLLAWANRFDLFGNVYLTQTERFFGEVRFLDRDGRFTGYTLQSPRKSDEGFDEELNFDFTSLFFEGDLGEIFPALDPLDKHGLDIGFSIGRQPFSFQEGMLLNDNLDSVGISKINLKPWTTVNHRVAFVWGASELNRNNLAVEDVNSTLYGIFNEIDWYKSTVAIDAIYVNSDDAGGKGFYGGVSATQRFGQYNTTFRILGSIPAGKETDHNRGGVLLFSQIGRTLEGSIDYIYVNSFWGIEEFRSASRGPNAGGPLSGPGILYESVGIGNYPSPLNNQADEAFGGALGYQKFLGSERQQILFEFGGRYSTLDLGQSALGAGLRYQRAMGRRQILRVDGTVIHGKNPRLANPATLDTDIRVGSRLEWVVKF